MDNLNISFEQQVVEALRGTNSIKDILEKVCRLDDGEFAIQIIGNQCFLYSKTNTVSTGVLGYELVTYVSVAIHEIIRLSELGIVSVFQVNMNNNIVIGDINLVKKTTSICQISNSVMTEYVKMDVFGGDRLKQYIENEYHTDAEVVAINELQIAKDTLQVTRRSIQITVAIFIVSMIVNFFIR